jgi:predicted alpha/beta-hydrolase family hydrolase
VRGTAVLREVETPVGPARTTTEGQASAPALVLGHGAGAGAGVQARDLLAARDAALQVGLRVVRVEQPWLVRGRRVAEAPARLDAAWQAVLATLDGPLVVGGRSAGARVACRCACTGSPDRPVLGVLALAFPLRPPGRVGASRLPELLAPAVPVLVVQGERDAFGVPEPVTGVQVHVVRGADHAFRVRRADARTSEGVAAEITEHVAHWLAVLLAPQMLT